MIKKNNFLAFAELVLFSLNLIDLSVCVSLVLKINSQGQKFMLPPDPLLWLRINYDHQLIVIPLRLSTVFLVR